MAIGFIGILLLTIHLFLGAGSIRNKTNTFDELNHLTAGYAYWTKNDFRLDPENGNLPQRWEALPLLTMGLRFPPIPITHEGMWLTSHRFFFNSGNPADRMLLAGRLMTLALSLALGLIVFSWSWELFGVAGGLTSFAIYCFSPTILANARLTTSDLAVTLFFLLSIRTYWRLLHRVSVRTILWAGLSVGGLMLSKMSAVLILPWALVMIAIRLIDPEPLSVTLDSTKIISDRRSRFKSHLTSTVTAATIAITVIWAGYGFRFKAAPGPQTLTFREWKVTLQGTNELKPAIAFARDHELLPEAWLFGFAYVISHADSHPAFLNGDHSDTGWTLFFPLAFLYKTPLTILALMTIALLLFLRDDGKRVARRELLPIVVFIAVYGTFAMSSHINIGLRHILPIYPPIFILCGMAAFLWDSEKWQGKTIFMALLCLMIVETTAIWPDYLAFFNLAAGGPQNGYRHLVDSSLDWGQDLKRLGIWLRSRHPVHSEPVYLSYFGTASPAYYDIPARVIVLDRYYPWSSDLRHVATRLLPGEYCISATNLQQTYLLGEGWNADLEREYWHLLRAVKIKQNEPRLKSGSKALNAELTRVLADLTFGRLCAYLRTREPDHTIGYSILIYDINAEQLNTALYGPPSGG